MIVRYVRLGLIAGMAFWIGWLSGTGNNTPHIACYELELSDGGCGMLMRYNKTTDW